MYLCVNVQNELPSRVIHFICGIFLGHFASRGSSKSQYLLASRMYFLVIDVGKEEKNYVRVSRKAHFLIFPCEKWDDGIFFFL